jgi:hypothetical protein
MLNPTPGLPNQPESSWSLQGLLLLVVVVVVAQVPAALPLLL